MNPDQLQEMIQWLNQQIVHLNESINQASQANNFGGVALYEGMRDAFMRCLNQLNNF